MLSIGAIASAAQGASYYEKDGYAAKDDPEHRDASAWFGKGAEALGLSGPVDPDTFRTILEGKVPDGSGTELGKRGRDGEITHRPGRDLTFSAPKSVSIAALVGGDERIVGVHDRAVKATLAWVEKNAVETRMQDPETGRMVRAGAQKTVIATFRHDTSRNLDPQLHTHSVLANMVQGEDGKWRTMANEKLYDSPEADRRDLPERARRRADPARVRHREDPCGRPLRDRGRLPRGDRAFSTRRAEIEAAMAERGLGTTADNPRHAERAALMTRATKREVDRDELRRVWQRQAADLGLDVGSFAPERGAAAASGPSGRIRHCPRLATWSRRRMGPGGIPRRAIANTRGLETPGCRPRRKGAGVPRQDRPQERGRTFPPRSRGAGSEAVAWAMAHLSEREAVFSRADLIAAALAYAPGTFTVETIEREVAGLEKDGTLHAVHLPGARDSLATDRSVGEERETVALMRAGVGRGQAPMRRSAVQAQLHKGALTAGQKEAVQLILSAKDRVVGVQGYAGTGKTTMLDRARTLAEKKGWRMVGLAPSASAVKTLAAEAGSSRRRCRGSSRGTPAWPRGASRSGVRARCGPPSRRRSWWSTRAPSPRRCRPGTCSGSRANSGSRAWCWWATPSSWTRSTPGSRSRSSRPPACRPR